MKSVDPLTDATRLQESLAWAVRHQLVEFPDAHPPDWLQPEAILRLGERSRGSSLGLCAMVARWAQHDSNWLAVLDSLGRSSARIQSFSRASDPRQVGVDSQTDRPKLFASLFRDHPDKPGLLPMLAAAVLRTPDPEAVALTPVRFEDFAEPAVRRAALLIELARAGLSAARATELAAVTMEMAESHRVLGYDAARILEGFECFDQASQRYLLELRGEHGLDNGWCPGRAN